MERKTLYNLERRFLEGSRLHIYLSFKEPQTFSIEKRDCTLFTVLSALRKVISREKLYDRRNTTCLIFNSELEWALDMKFLHVTEIQDVVLSQMVAIEPPSNSGFSQDRERPRSNRSTFDIEAPYFVRPDFLKVLQQVPGVKPTTTVFKFREITSLLSQYILLNKDKFFDNRNIKIADVSNDILGIAFNVTIFHRSQVMTLLRQQLLPISSFMTLRDGKIVPHYKHFA